MDKISVLIPIFNGEKFIVETIDSVLNQTVKPFEIIVYDDGSTDNSVDVILKHPTKFPIRIIKGMKNRGIGFVRKKLVEESKGKYVCFISADDIMMPNYIEEMLKASKEYPNHIIYSNYNFIDGNGNFITEFIVDNHDNEEEWIMSCIFEAKNNTMSVCYNIFAPTKILKENKFDPKLRYGEDLEHLLRCVLVKKIKYFHIDKPLFNYRRHQTAVTTIESKNIPENNKKIFEKINKMLDREIL